MPRSHTKPGAGVSRFKLALVAVLAVVLLVVLIVQFGGASNTQGADERENTVKGRPSTPAQERAAARPQNVRKHSKPRLTTAPWPVFDRADVVRYDPFATPARFLSQQAAAQDKQSADKAASAADKVVKKQADLDRALAALQQQGVTMVIGGSKGRVAVVGDQTVGVGDVLDGFRVITIAPDGITLRQSLDEEE
jgi:hypothetical protein